MSRLVLIAAGVGLLSGCGHRDAVVDNWSEPITGMEFIRIEAGGFEMGLRADEPADLRAAPLHSVLIPDAFYLGRFEVTQAQWAQVMGARPSHFSTCGEGCPVENVSWHEVQDFLRRLNESNSGWRFRLPTEAEWEYACRANGDRPYGAMEQLDPSLANFDSRIPFDGIVDSVFRGGPTQVGSFPSNPLGLHDMQGNVWEWVQDEFCPYPEGPAVAPIGECQTDSIPIRGGSWYFSANAARCGRRYIHHRDDRGFSLGFRVLATKSQVSGDG